MKSSELTSTVRTIFCVLDSKACLPQHVLMLSSCENAGLGGDEAVG
jgi:hypothetical protein